MISIVAIVFVSAFAYSTQLVDLPLGEGRILETAAVKICELSISDTIGSNGNVCIKGRFIAQIQVEMNHNQPYRYNDLISRLQKMGLCSQIKYVEPEQCNPQCDGACPVK